MELTPRTFDEAEKLKVESELHLSAAEVALLRLNHQVPSEHKFRREDVYWLDLCLTPRRPLARARYEDRWGPHRFAPMGSIAALPPRFDIHLKNEGGRHLSIICALSAASVERWLPPDFEWTDRRLEGCLDISSPTIRELMTRMVREIRHPGLAYRELCDSIVFELGIELARYVAAIAEPVDHGGLASWRLRVIEKRLDVEGPLPSLAELANLCSISTRQLTRGFRTSRGCSLRDYMNQNRMETAKRRLAGRESIKSIGLAAGFSDQSTFTYAFRRATGFTPLQFRRRLLQRMESGTTRRGAVR